jgi:trimeric autotransporter adhesin
MSKIGRVLATMLLVALSSWSCGSTGPDASPAVSAIVVTPASSTIVLNGQLPLQAQVRDESGDIVSDAAITWTVQDPKIVSVSEAGVVRALAVGTSQVAANALGKSGVAVITVTRAPVASVALIPNRVDVTVGATFQLSASALAADGTAMPDRPITWATSNPGAATVSASGLVTGVSTGTATITAASEGKTSTSAVTIGPAAVARIDLNPATVSVQAGQTQQLTAVVKDARGNVLTGRTVVWTSDNTAVASVNGGLVTTSKSGVATITASVGGVSGTATVTVNPGPPATVTVTAPSSSVQVGSTMQLTATALDSKGNDVLNQSFLWTSSNTTIATVSSSGVVTGKRSGNATIAAQVGGKSGSVQISVK